MKLREYLASKAISLCFTAIAAALWGVFAYLTGANAALLWGSIVFFTATVILRHILGFVFAKNRLEKLSRTKDVLSRKYLLGELIPAPYDATEREYFEIMKEISRSAIGAVEDNEREKKEYFDSVEKWIHEIKTPLTACSLICDNGGDVAKLRRELKKADNLTDTVLQYARLRSPEHDTAVTEISAAKIINDAVKSQCELLTAAKIRVEVIGDFTAHTDGKALAFMIKQLIINCAKYCAGCKITITARDGVITFSDNGSGIAAHELPRIFDRGFTGGGKTGTGMGLYIVSQLCERLSVSLDVASRENVGTSFTFTFPEYNENVISVQNGVRQ